MTGNSLQSWGRELKKTLLLAVPITAGHVSHMILGLTDTLMIGRVGVVSLAGAALGNMICHVFMIVGIGVLTSVSVLVSHAFGAGQKAEAGEMLRRGLAIAIVTGFAMFLMIWAVFPLMFKIGQPDYVVIISQPYLWLQAISLPFVLSIITFRNYSEALDAPWPAFWCGLLSVILNIFLNWVLIYGNLGAPAMGLVGAGLATLIARIANLVILIGWLRLDRRFRDSWPAMWIARIPWSGIMSMLKLGFPVGLQLLMEVGAFNLTVLLMGWLGTVEMAAHQVAITCAATTFMFPLGISLAVAIRVGHVIGAGEKFRARRVAFGALGFAALLSGCFTALFLVLNDQIAGLFTKDAETVLLAASLLIVAGIFQLVDGSQALAIGALRGCKDVKIPTWIIFAAYWLLGLPFGSALAFGFGVGAVGLWIGLAFGLGIAAVGLIWRFVLVTRAYGHS
ncbi:MAG: MATE family efflux transporter [Puniceicoccaceae bacterium]